MVNEIDSTIAQEQSTEKPKSFRIPVYSGIFEHYTEVGDAIWLLLYYIDKTTKEESHENPEGGRVGLILGDSPIRDATVAESFNCDKRTICRWRNRLAKIGYITQRVTPYGTVVRVQKSKKFGIQNRDITAQPKEPNRDKFVPPATGGGTQTARSGTRSARSGTQTALAKKTGHAVHDETERHLMSEMYLAKVGRKQRLYPKEAEKLEALEAKHAPNVIRDCYALYLDGFDFEDGSAAWAVSKGFPFGHFANHFEEILEFADRNRREELEMDFRSDRLPEYFDPHTYCEVLIAKTGKRELALRENAEKWVTNGYATKIFEPSEYRLIPAEMVQVMHYREKYWIAEKKAQKYIETGIVTEVKG